MYVDRQAAGGSVEIASRPAEITSETARTEWQEMVREHTRPFILGGTALEAAGVVTAVAVQELPPAGHSAVEPLGTGVGIALAVGGLVSIWHGRRVRRTAHSSR